MLVLKASVVLAVLVVLFESVGIASQDFCWRCGTSR
jgi:hypothetical protein